MKSIYLQAALLTTIFATMSGCQHISGPANAASLKLGEMNLSKDIKSDVFIQRQLDVLKKDPKNTDAMNRLGEAYIQKGRETGNLDWYNRAKNTLFGALAIAPKDHVTLHNVAWVSTVFHQFAEAITYANQAIAIKPADHFAFGVLSDAYMETGDYDKAIEVTQKMIDLRPDMASFSRAAAVQVVKGDNKGAAILLMRAIGAGGNYPENTAWCRTQLGDLYFKEGSPPAAESQYKKVLESMPTYRFAQAGMARVRASQGKNDEAIELYTKATAEHPQIAMVIEFGEFLDSVGKRAEAQAQFDKVEPLVREHQAHGIEGDDLIQAMYYLDHNGDKAKALNLAENGVKTHKSIAAYATLAWAQLKNNKPDDAVRSIELAMRTRPADSLLAYRASKIYEAAGKMAEAERYSTLAQSINPHFSYLYAKDAFEHRIATK